MTARFNYYVRLVQGKGLVAKLIEFKESDWPSHVELLRCHGDTDAPIDVIGARYPGGIRVRHPDRCPIKREAWYKVPVPSDACEHAWSIMQALVGKRYDLVDIFGIALNEDWHKDGRYICSEAVAYAFEVAGCPLFATSQPVRRILPRDYLLTPVLKLAFDNAVANAPTYDNTAHGKHV